MKTFGIHNYDLDCAVSALVYKWANKIPNYNYVIESMHHYRIANYCTKFVNKKEGNYIFFGYLNKELCKEGCDPTKFKSIQKTSHQSLTKTLYDKFKGKVEFTIEQKTLIAMVVD